MKTEAAKPASNTGISEQVALVSRVGLPGLVYGVQELTANDAMTQRGATQSIAEEVGCRLVLDTAGLTRNLSIKLPSEISIPLDVLAGP